MTADVFDEDHHVHYNERAVDVPGEGANGAGANGTRMRSVTNGAQSAHSARPPMTIADIIRARMKANMANQENKAVSTINSSMRNVVFWYSC